MTVAEKIIKHVRVLPEDAQAEVLDFVEHLESKTMVVKVEPAEWGTFSLSQAMRGIESEESLYSINDLKETFV